MMPYSVWPPNWLINLNRLPETSAVTGLIRHAAREDIVPGDLGNQVNLTQAGQYSCQILAEKLNKKLQRIYSSPVRRCLQTAEYLVCAAADPHTKTSRLLGDPGVFIVDGQQTQNYFLSAAPQTIVKQLLSTQNNPPGFCRSTTASVYTLIDFLLKNTTRPGLTLFITHDVILSVVLGSIFPEQNLDIIWPTYLEGLFFWRQENFLHMVYRDQYKNLMLKNFADTENNNAIGIYSQ